MVCDVLMVDSISDQTLSNSFPFLCNYTFLVMVGCLPVSGFVGTVVDVHRIFVEDLVEF